PLIMTGLRSATVQVVATATLAALAGGGGLGRIITAGFGNYDTAQVVAGALLVAVLALAVEGALVLAERLLDPMRGRRRAARSASGPRTTSRRAPARTDATGPELIRTD
ncbi:ABC transporter permease, partial [Streptomyces exfoliatus]